MSYTAKEIDRMPIEEVEQLAENLTPAQKDEWAGAGYSGASYVRITS